MCGRFANSEPISVSAVRLEADPTVDDTAWRPSWNCRPGTALPVAIEDAGGRRIGLMTWGWRRDWAERILINARLESLNRSRTWAPALVDHRCLVPSTGWWEWLREGGRGRPFFHRLDEARPFALAGLWERDGDDGRFAVITCPARGEAAEVHGRMPLLLDAAGVDRWLGGAGPDDCHAESAGLPVHAYETAPFKTGDDGPDLIRPR